MAWTAPTVPYFTVGEVVTATKMNVLSDDLRHLRGLDGDIYLEDDLGVGTTTPLSNAPAAWSRALKVAVSTPGSSVAGLAVEGKGAAGSFSVADICGINQSATGSDKRCGVINFQTGTDADSGLMTFYTRNAGGFVSAMVMAQDGKIGLGTSTPQGRLHVNASGFGVLTLAASGVNGTLQTLTQNGTIPRAGAFYLMDRNNSSGALFPSSGNGIAVGSLFSYTNTDQITVSITAGGAVTVQRTSGAAATHDITMFILFL